MTYQQRIDPGPTRAKLTAADFTLLADAGAFEGYARTELIEGEIWVVNSVHRWHARVQSEFCAEIVMALRAAGIGLTAYSAGSVSMSDDSVPEPDISVGEREGEVEEGYIPLDRMKLAVEISDSSKDMDLRRKAKLYSRHGVPEYWVVSREDRCIVQHAEPANSGYLRIDRITFGEPVTAATLPLTVATDMLFG